MRLQRALATAVLAGAFLAPMRDAAAEVLGEKPRYLSRVLNPVPNETAMTARIWAPGLDDGYVPQGITVAEGEVLLSAYRSMDPKISTGPCRVFRVQPGTGRSSGSFDLPADCGHAGGLAYLGEGRLVVADTHRLYRIDLRKAIAEGDTRHAVQSVVALGGEVRGSFVDFDGTDVWVGVFDTHLDRSKIYRLPLAIFDEPNSKGALREDRALTVLSIPTHAQGAAFDREGNLWITTSTSRFGMLHRLNPKTGEKLVSYEMVIGIEDIGFDREGKLWSVSEAGSQRWSRWSQTFPVLFQVDVGRLR